MMNINSVVHVQKFKKNMQMKLYKLGLLLNIFFSS